MRIVESRCVFICGDTKHENVHMKYITVYALLMYISLVLHIYQENSIISNIRQREH